MSQHANVFHVLNVLVVLCGWYFQKDSSDNFPICSRYCFVRLGGAKFPMTRHAIFPESACEGFFVKKQPL